MNTKEQDITGVIKNSDVNQIGEIKIFNVHIHPRFDTSSEKLDTIYLIYHDRSQQEKRVSFRKKLLIYRKNKGWKIFAREEDEIDLDIIDASISREKHAIFYIKDGQIYVEDLDSKNGVYVNGKKVKIAKLNEGDLIRIGSGLVFRLEYYPNKITTKEFKPLPVSNEIAKKLNHKDIIKTDRGLYFMPTQSGKFEIDDKIVEIKESNEKEKLKNLEMLFYEKAPHEVIKKYIFSMLHGIRERKKDLIDKIREYSQRNEINEEIVRLIEDVIYDE